jgi:predicted enzyme related to lactoylglutathione lyase
MNKIVHFEIVAIDPMRAIDFYTKALGWEFKKFEGSGGDMEYWNVICAPQNTPNAINGGLRKEMGTDVKERTKSVNGFINFAAVEDIEDILKKVESSGGEIMQPKMSVPKVGWLAYCLDTEGNMFGVIQPEM